LGKAPDLEILWFDMNYWGMSISWYEFQELTYQQIAKFRQRMKNIQRRERENAKKGGKR